MITYELAGIEGRRLTGSEVRKVCAACQRHLHPEAKVIKLKYYSETIICHSCLQEIINLLRQQDTFYGLMKE